MKKDTKIYIGIAIGITAGITIGLLCTTDKGKKLIAEIQDAAGQADKEIKKAIQMFEDKLEQSKEYAARLQKKTTKAVKQKLG
jgi:gas vesicle protein